MPLFSLDELEAAIPIVRSLVPPTPAYAWPLLARRAGVGVVVKHENHTPTGSFKARGGIVYAEALRRAGSLPRGLVTATRGNHGQSVALAAARLGLPAVIVVPEGNSAEKNAAMEAFGGELVTAGRDFDESRVVAERIQHERGYHFVPAFHRELVKGVATYAHELLTAHPDLDVVYVPIGMGSGICGLITVRDLLGLETDIVGVVAAKAPAFALSFEAGRIVPTQTARTFADGMACREPQAEPFEIIRQGAARIVTVSEDEIAAAVRMLFTDTHNTA
jgi:threonine dehydratase